MKNPMRGARILTKFMAVWTVGFLVYDIVFGMYWFAVLMAVLTVLWVFFIPSMDRKMREQKTKVDAVYAHALRELEFRLEGRDR